MTDARRRVERTRRPNAKLWAAAIALWVLPAIIGLLTREMQWDETDFIAWGVMLAVAFGAMQLLCRRSSQLTYRAGAALTAAVGFVTIWANLAVGMIGSEDNRFNLLFGGVLAVPLLVGTLRGFTARSLAAAAAAAATLQGTLALIGSASDPRGGVFSAMFVLPWLLAGALFAHAAHRDAQRRS